MVCGNARERSGRMYLRYRTARPSMPISLATIALTPAHPGAISGLLTFRSNHPLMAVVVRDSHPLNGARFSSQEVKRFFGIEPNRPTAAQQASKAANQSNVF